MKNKTKLLIACQINNLSKVKKILQEYLTIDLATNKGQCFRIAIKDNSPEMLKLLLDYYEDNVLRKQPDLPGYYKAKKKLRDILEDAIESFEISEEISNLMNKYIEMGSSSDDEETKQEFGIVSGEFDFDDSLSYHTPDNSEHLDAAHFHHQHCVDLLGLK